jgi:hypothetical protein
MCESLSSALDDPQKLAEITAGLQMMAPTQTKVGALGNITNGALTGLQTYGTAKQQERANRQSDLQTLLGIQSSIYSAELPKMLQQGAAYQPPPELQAVNQRINELATAGNLSGSSKKALAQSAPPPAPSPGLINQNFSGADPSFDPGLLGRAPGQVSPQPSQPPAPQQPPQSGGVPTNLFGVPMSAFTAASMAKNPGALEFLKSVVDARKPVNGRPGGTVMGYDANGNQTMTYLPKLETGQTASFGPNGQVNVGVAPGYLDAVSAINRTTAGATQAGKQAETYVDVPIGNAQTMRMTNAQYEAYKARQQQPPQPIPQAVIDADRSGLPFSATQAPGGPVQFQQGGPKVAQVTVTEPSKLIGNPNMGGLGVTPNPAAIAGAVKDAEAGATNRQKIITEDYQDLSRQNVTAQTVISRLQTIKQLGPQAITGAEAEKRDFFNGLLSLAGLKSAESAKTASDLVDKNASQIALAIGTGPNGTDALRSLAQMANPNRHMTLDAMQRAADSIIAPLAMTQAKTQMLTPYFAHGDTANYLQQKQQFEQAADPRVWELQALPAAQQKAYVQSLSPQDARGLLMKRQALRQLGVIQ